ncbi:hypothetical protein [Jiella sp. M17.18]|uniref:hypothetical protein n=1 Tax=Jiella sp. M17.18 TaxID=3234247 RepID=UPI0034DE64CB
MNRLATTVALGIWAGFCGFGSLRLLHEGGLTTELLGQGAGHLLDRLQMPAIGLDRPQAIAFAAILAALAIALGQAIVKIQAQPPGRARAGEPYAAAALSALFAFFAAASLAGSPIAAFFGDGASFTLWIAVSFGALLFDHLMSDEDDPEDEASFRAVLRAIREAEEDAIARRRGSAPHRVAQHRDEKDFR